MKLIEYAKSCTEQNLFVCIYSLGGSIWQVNHDLADGRYELDKEASHFLRESQAIMQAMVGSTNRFGVLLPLGDNNCATPSYWDWYHKLKKWWAELSIDEKDLVIDQINKETKG